MNMLHDPSARMFIVEGWVEPEDFLAEVRSYGVLTDRQYVSLGYAVKESHNKYRLLKKPPEDYISLAQEPIKVMSYRY